MNNRDLTGIGFLLTWEKLDRLETKLDRILKLENQEMSDLSRITDEVAQNTDATQSAIALLGELANEIRNAGTDQGALDALADSLDQNSEALAAAVLENTNPTPEPAPEG